MTKKTSFSLVIMLTLLQFCLIKPVLASKSILLLGDSLSASYGMKQNEGWVALLNAQLVNDKLPVTINNASISGETTAGGLSRIASILKAQKYDYLLIELGGNDGLRGFPPNIIKNNLLQIIDIAKQNNVEVWVMEIQIPPNYGPRYSTMFQQTFKEATQETSTVLIPFFISEVAKQANLMQADGIHPTKDAQPLIANIMLNQLKELLAL